MAKTTSAGFITLGEYYDLKKKQQSSHLCVGIVCGCGLRLAVYLRGKNAKKYRHNEEYGSARWGNAQDIAPFVAPKFEDNIILTQTERLMMSNRPANPKNARNKNVLIVGGSGSGKTRFWIKPSAPVRAI